MTRLLATTIAAGVLVLAIYWVEPWITAASNPEKRFWGWFQGHEKELYDFEANREPVFDQLGKALEKVGGDLTFEIGPKLANGKREFVISADGILSSFPKVESLFAAAPRLDRWIIVKFRPRGSATTIELNGKELKGAEVRYHLLQDANPHKVGILILLPGYRKSSNPDYERMAFLLLDGVLGEYDVETRVGTVAFAATDSPDAQGSRPLSALALEFDRRFNRRVP